MATAAASLIDYELMSAYAAAAEPSSIYYSPLQASKPRYELPLVRYGKTIFRLSRPIEISLYPEQDGLWICESELISSSVHADTLEKALLAFCEDFAVLWDEIAKAPDDHLAPDAQQLKQVLRALVRAVEQEH